MAETKINDHLQSVADDADESDVEQASSSCHYSTVELTNAGIDVIPVQYLLSQNDYTPQLVRNLFLARNQLLEVPPEIALFANLTTLDISNNGLANVSEALGALNRLRVLIARNNMLDDDCLPKSLNRLTNLEAVNLSSNLLENVPSALFDMPLLKTLHLGANRIQSLPYRIRDMQALEVLYLGGNQLREIPATIGHLRRLSSLSLCDNRLETIPSTIAELQAMQSLSLHNNLLKTLPTEIVKLRNLHQLSLRNNPLVHQFIRDMAFSPPSLKELSARIARISLPYSLNNQVLPTILLAYINTANQCVNPKCKGVYFEACVEHIKFVDFCGKYRVPLLQYLCSPRCSSTNPAYALSDASNTSDSELSSEDVGPSQLKLKKVLLG